MSLTGVAIPETPFRILRQTSATVLPTDETIPKSAIKVHYYPWLFSNNKALYIR